MHTISQLIDKYIADMDGTPERVGLKPLGDSHRYSLLAMKRTMLGPIFAAKLHKNQVKEYARERRVTVCPATINQNICYLSGVLDYAGSEWDDCEDVSSAAIKIARKSLVKHNLIGKSAPRTRVPTEDELRRLTELLGEQDKKSKMRVVEVLLFALISTRRLSEICRMTHGDIDWENRDDDGNIAPMYMIRDVKHPTRRLGNHKTFALLDPMPEIIRRQPRLTESPDERVFPFVSKSVGRRYTEAKKALGIQNLRFHDNRREATTRWLKILPAGKVRLITGHETTQILERVYDASKPERLHAEIAEINRRAAA